MFWYIAFDQRVGAATSFARDPRVIAITRLRANFLCELEGCLNHVFMGADGKPYVETHHLTMLSEGGADVPENTVAICAIHHRELHHGRQKAAMKEALQKRRLSSPLAHDEF